MKDKFNFIPYKPSENGLHSFPEYTNAYWTDALLDASNSIGRQKIADFLSILLKDLVCFTASNHTNGVVLVDDAKYLHSPSQAVDILTGELHEAGWSEPLSPNEDQPDGLNAARGTYDGLMLIGRENFGDKYILVPGADCTSLGVRGQLLNGEEFIAAVHAGRKGTMTGIVESLASILKYSGVIKESLEVFVGPATQGIEVPLSLLEEESAQSPGGQYNCFKNVAISEPYISDGQVKVKYNNQFDVIRRVVEQIGVNKSQVNIIDSHTESNKRLHSYRATKTAKRNSLILGFGQ